MKDCKFKTEGGMSDLQPTRGTNCVAYMYETYVRTKRKKIDNSGRWVHAAESANAQSEVLQTSAMQVGEPFQNGGIT